jgi:hypothetical protein
VFKLSNYLYNKILHLFILKVLLSVLMYQYFMVYVLLINLSLSIKLKMLSIK